MIVRSFAPPRTLGPGKLLIVALAAVICVLAALSVSRASAAESCGYGTGGPYAPNLCWFDMTDYNDAQARSAEGQQMSITLPGGYVVKFTLTSRAVPGHIWRGVESRAAPLETRFAFGVAGGGYVGIPDKPVLYSQGPGGTNGVELKLSNISVVDSSNQPVTGYSFVIADAENNVAGENFTWTSDKPLSLLGVLAEKAPAGCHTGLSGLGTTSVTCTGQGGEVGQPNPRYDGVVIGADTPSSIGLSMTTFARSGVAFAIMTSKVQVTKNVVGRVRGTDSFDISAESPEGSILDTESTGPANTATTGEITVLPLSTGASYTLGEAPTPASGTRQADYSRSWACTNNGVSEPSLPSGSGPSVSVSPEAGDFIACTVTNTQLPADLSVQKTANVEFASEGDTITYTLQAENQGPSTADSTVLKDTLPPDLEYVSDDLGCSAVAQIVECELGTLADGEARTVHIEAKVQSGAAGSLQTNTAKISALQPDSEPANDESSVSTPITPFVDLAISKSVSPKVAGSLGQKVIFTLEVENKGENETSAATVTDVLPEGIAYVSDTGSCVFSAPSTVECEAGALAKGAKKTIEIEAEVEALAAGKANKNTASVAGPLFDPDLTNNEASATLEVEPLSDLAITKTAGTASVKPGDEITYSIKAENKGPTIEASAQITDTLPGDLEYISSDPTCAGSVPPVIECALGSLADGESKTIQIVAKVLASSGTIENTAEVGGANPDAELANNSSTATTPIEPVSDLAIIKSASAASVNPGDPLTYTLEVENKGPSTSGPTTVTDDLPVGLSYLSDDGACEATKVGEITCPLGSLASGATKTIHVVVVVAGSATGSLGNTATVTGSNFDPELTNNESTATITVEQIADLAITKTASTSTIKPGEQLTYTIEVENKGPSTSDPTMVTDTLPAGVSHLSNDAGCNTAALPTVTCNLGSLGAGATRTFHIVVEVTAGAGSIENTASVGGPLPDPEPVNDEDSATTAVEPVSDLAITKTAGAAAVKPGEQLTYTLGVENKGPSDSSSTIVTDTLPAQLTYVEDDAGCNVSALPTVTCDLGNITTSVAVVIEIVTEVKAGASGEIENGARVSGSNLDLEPDNDEATSTTPITPLAADLALKKTAASNSPARVGDTITYTLAASNNGPDPSPESVVTDNLPTTLTYVSDDGGCDTSALPKVECDLGTLANGETKSFNIVTRVAGTPGGSIVNTAAVRGARTDPVSSNNPDSAQTPIASDPPVGDSPSSSSPSPQPPKPPKHKKPQAKPSKSRLVLEKHANRSFARPGSVIAYTITVSNKGDAAARNVKVCDKPPAQQKTLRTEPTVKDKSAPCWRLRKLPAGKKRVFRLTAEVAGNSGAAVQRNRASVKAANVKGAGKASAAVQVKPLPNTACGSRQLRSLMPPGFVPLC